MTQEYVTTQQVTAWATEQDGQAGYSVKDADGVITWQAKQAFEALHVPMGHTGHLTAEQRNVVADKALNDDRVIKLTALLNAERVRAPSSQRLNSLERQQMEIQLAAMSLLANVLADRVDDFTPAPATESAAK